MDSHDNKPSGTVRWESPSNIAIVKYWGKRGEQLPCNPSVSLTLSRCKTETSVTCEPSDRLELRFLFEGGENPAFADKVERFLAARAREYPWIGRTRFTIESRNTFPHSSGIASSASSMSALAMCLLDIDRQAGGKSAVDLREASRLARLASGSAARSVYPHAALWGSTECHPDSSDAYAVALADETHPVFKTLRDSILVVSGSAKPVSSRAGHALMDGNPYAPARYAQAREHTEALLRAMRDGDLDTFVSIAEAEALQLHALMMCSSPAFILMRPATLTMIGEIRRFREATGIPACFTLDAGPNVHLLYPERHVAEVEAFIEERLAPLCQDAMWIADRVGEGPKKLS